MPEHSRAWLERAISLAKQLGYQDDVKHWQKELNKLDGVDNG